MLIMFTLQVQAQNIYKMGNYKVYDCKGIFTDSDLGLTKGDYSHNENYIFSVCVPGGDYVSLQFDSFCTEKDVDFLQFYDGRDTFGTKIGPRYHGTNKPGTIQSSDSCLTVYFQTDKSVACYGWKATWQTKVLPLPQPKFLNVPQVSCSTSVLRVRLDQKFVCDSIRDTSFTLTGAFAPAVTKVTPIGCVNGLTDSFEITLAGGLNRGGAYTLRFRGVKYDICDSAWNLTAVVIFNITDCPIIVDLDAVPDTICMGGCSNIQAVITGGDSTKYVYNWNQGLPPVKPTIKVCPTVSGWYRLTVSDGVALPGTDSVWITVLPKPQAPKDTSVCQSGGAFSLSGNPSGGSWAGKGITNATTGAYSPPQAGAGRDTVRYFLNGCTDTVVVDVRGISGGGPNAACPGAAPFYVSGFTPPGGTWSGPKINAAGLFNPDTSGTYVVTYTWNGCVSTKTINVEQLSVTDADTVCLSAGNITLNFTPKGGFWTGTGITNSSLGIFNTGTAGVGTKNLIYIMNGCRDTTKMTVENINARGNQVVCLQQPAFTMLQGLPAGGYWKGKGVADSALGIYDPALVGQVANDTIEYFYGGCSAKKIMFIRNIVVGIKSRSFCIEQPILLLDFNSVQVTPFGGQWTGNGISSQYYFTAANAGYGTHKLIYNFNGCLDSTVFTIYPKSVLQPDTTFCIADPPFKLYNGQSGGYFKGKGITDTLLGIFNPGIAGVGSHLIRYVSKYGCKDSFTLQVTPLPVVNLSGLDPVYCYNNLPVNLTGSPAGGIFWGKGVSGSTYNPKDAGSGSDKVYYRYGTATCYRIDSFQVSVRDTLKVKASASEDTVCIGANIQLDASASGGMAPANTYLWSNGQGSRSVFEIPSSSGWHSVVADDACSEMAFDSVYIVVNPKVTATIETSPIKCYGQSGFAEVFPGDGSVYDITWSVQPPVKAARLQAPVTNRYFVHIKNVSTGCFMDTFAVIPGYPKLKASFITIPRAGFCLDPFNPVLNIINQSQGADSGIWTFGDGSFEMYNSLVNPSHAYAADTNYYRVKLLVFNEGGCRDSMELPVCLNDSVYALIPNAFTPDGNHRNEVFKPVVAGARQYNLKVYDRWGELIFESDNINEGWDGSYLGKPCQNGVYLYLLTYKGRKSITKQESGTLLLLR